MKHWLATKLENPIFDEQVRQMNAFLDTVGSNTTPEQNEVLYGVKNIDSLKKIQQKQIAQTIKEKENSLKNTFLHFNENGTLYYSFGVLPDTACWYFEGEKNLVFDEKKLKGMGSVVKIELVKLDENELQLRFQENGFSSTATFIPSSK